MDNEFDESQTPRGKPPGIWQGLQLCIVQGSVCILIVLLALCVKYMGGSIYQECIDWFHALMTQNNVLASPTTNATSIVTDIVSPPIEVASIRAVSAAVYEKPNTSAPLSEGVLTSPYGYRTDPFDEQTVTFHKGVDIAAAEGTKLMSIRDGVVLEAGESEGYGKYVLIQCDEQHMFLYAHCSEILVTVNDAVDAGECVALVGNTGRSTGSHVHIEWRENGEAIDPSAAISLAQYV